MNATTEPATTDAIDLVDASSKCPCCGERRVDFLMWDEDFTVVTCESCGSVYDPSEYA